MAQRYPATMLAALMLSAPLVLSGCSPSLDMQGVDPREYYAENPIVNKVSTQTQAHAVVFEKGASKLDKWEVSRFREAVFDKSMLSLQSAKVQLSRADMKNEQRKASIKKMFKFMGYTGHNITFEASDLAAQDQALVQLTFAVVVPPNCPDWRMSPSHNFGNGETANFGCATAVNLGQMVADPRDLERGTGELPPALSERGDAVLRTYRTGGAATPASGTPGTLPAANASSDTTQAAPQAAPQ
ncbi:MAG: CpaD family pilus assembly protein [Rickettsiales bacterium]|nr:CpaD family pilus assembly protein [Rickettsiales bacterium]